MSSLYRPGRPAAQVLVLIDRGTTSAARILSRLCLAEGSEEAALRRRRERREARQQSKRRRLGREEEEEESEEGWQPQWGRQRRAGSPADAAQPFDVPYPVPCPARVVRKVTGLKALGGLGLGGRVGGWGPGTASRMRSV